MERSTVPMGPHLLLSPAAAHNSHSHSRCRPFYLAALLVLATGWRSLELIRQIRAAESLNEMRLTILRQAGQACLDMPFVAAFPCVGVSVWFSLRSQLPHTPPGILWEPTVPIWAAALLTIIGLWRVLPLSFDLAACSNAPERRSAVAKQLLLGCFDPIAVGAGLLIACSVYRIPSTWHSLVTLGGKGGLIRVREVRGGMRRALASHWILTSQALSVLIDLPFAAMAVVVTLSVYRAPALGSRLSREWPLSAEKRAQLLGASPLACRLLGVERPGRSESHTAARGPEPNAAERLPFDVLMLIMRASVRSHEHRSICAAEQVSSSWHAALTRHHASETRLLWLKLLDGAWHRSRLSGDALRQLLHDNGAGSRQRSKSVLSASESSAFNPKRAFAQLHRRERPTTRKKATAKAGQLVNAASEWLRSSRRAACLSHFVGLLLDLPFLILAVPVLLSWRLPALLVDVKLAAAATPASFYPTLRASALTHCLLLPLDVPLAFLGAAICAIRELLLDLGLHELCDAMDGGFDASLEDARRIPRDGTAGIPSLLTLTLSGGTPHLWLLRQVAVLLLHTLHLLLGMLLLLSWRCQILASRVAECESRRELRWLTLTQFGWLLADLLCLPLLLLVGLTMWRVNAATQNNAQRPPHTRPSCLLPRPLVHPLLRSSRLLIPPLPLTLPSASSIFHPHLSCPQVPSFISLMRQRSFRHGGGLKFGSAAFTSFTLVVTDVWCLLLLTLVLLTCIRAPHLLYSLNALRRVYRELWRRMRLQTNDAHAAQLIQLLLEQEANSLASVGLDELCTYAVGGLHAFMRADASSTSGGGLVFATDVDLRFTHFLLPSRLVLGSGGALSELSVAPSGQGGSISRVSTLGPEPTPCLLL